MTATQPTTYSLTTVNRSDGSVDGHRAGCRDISRAVRKDYGPRASQPGHIDEFAFTADYATKHDVWLDYNSDFLNEGSGAYPINWLPCADHTPQGDPDDEDAYATEPEVEADPEPKPMTKTEAYRWLARAREDVLEAKTLVYRAGSVTNVRETVLDAVGALTMLLDALDGDGINGITD